MFLEGRINAEDINSHCEPYRDVADVSPKSPGDDNKYKCVTSEELVRRKEMYNGLNDHEWVQKSAERGSPQRLDGSESEKESARQVMRKMDIYFREEMKGNNLYSYEMRASCKNHHELCAFWAGLGECNSNFRFMINRCTAACRLCLLNYIHQNPSD